QTTYMLIMAGLTAVPVRDEAQQILRLLTTQLAGEGPGATLAELLIGAVPQGIYQQMWRTRRGKDLARRLAFRDLSLREFYHLPAQLFMAEALHQMALPGELSP